MRNMRRNFKPKTLRQIKEYNTIIIEDLDKIEKNKQTVIKKTNRKRSTANTSKNTHDSNNKKPSKQKYIALNKDKVIYQIECDDGVIKEHRKYLRHVDSWHVAGFYRHYKSGKVIWIEPQIRGVNKEKAKTQKYIVK